MHSLWLDLRHGVRLLRRDPVFALTSVLALAVGIGVTSSIFSVVNSVLLRPLPYEEPDRLVIVWERSLERGLPHMYVSPPNYSDWRQQNSVFEEMAAFDTRLLFMNQDGDPLPVSGAEVSASLFATLGVTPALGRSFIEEDDRPDSEAVVILSQRIWRTHFGGDSGIVGEAIQLDNRSYRVVGVMPSGFDFPPPIVEEGIGQPSKADVWVPMAMDMQGGNRSAHFMTVIARLGSVVGLERAAADMTTLARRLELQYPDSNSDWDVTLVPLHEQVVGDVRTQLLVLLGAVAFVLLIACVNVANLLLARGTARQRELAVRAALGAGRARVIRQLLTESVLLAALGGAIGLALAFGGLRVLLRAAPQNVPRLSEAGLDLRVLGFAVVISLLTGILFGLAPVFQRSSLSISERLREGGRSQSESRAGGRLRSVFVVCQVALALMLLVGAGLFLQSFVRLRDVEKGFRPDHVLTMRLTLPRARYQEDDHRIAAYTELGQRIGDVAGVEAAGLISDIPLTSDREGTSFVFEGESDPPEGENRTINFATVTPGYFEAMGIRVLQGRDFDERDSPDGEPTIIVNEAFARVFLSQTDPYNRRVVVGGPRRIVGIIGDVRHATAREEPNPTAYLPYSQAPWSASMSVAVRTNGRTEAVRTAIHEELRRFDPGLPVYQVKTMGEVLAESIARELFSSFLMLVFSAIALLLAAVGIYGVISYSVSRRTQEAGLRMALGARPRDILRLVVGQGMRLVAIGVLAGLAAAFALVRTLRSLLFGVEATDPATFVSVVLMLVGVALVACYMPARRAARVDPMVALRWE